MYSRFLANINQQAYFQSLRESFFGSIRIKLPPVWLQGVAHLRHFRLEYHHIGDAVHIGDLFRSVEIEGKGLGCREFLQVIGVVAGGDLCLGAPEIPDQFNFAFRPMYVHGFCSFHKITP